MFKALCLVLALTFVCGLGVIQARQPSQWVIYHYDESGGTLPCEGVFSPGTSLSDNIMDLTCYHPSPIVTYEYYVHYGQSEGQWEY